eukprot:TRINITY_DN5609_c0_g1_i1.p1 TRINITY_DN5609_c0_g1~~TRINITY_DN5609_c0_g1_i1.p1  ORF type:complete len:414 (+),score=32.40 TRINITY_DN5609_c0_g1_i1:66-1307(+)
MNSKAPPPTNHNYYYNQLGTYGRSEYTTNTTYTDPEVNVTNIPPPVRYLSTTSTSPPPPVVNTSSYPITTPVSVVSNNIGGPPETQLYSNWFPSNPIPSSSVPTLPFSYYSALQLPPQQPVLYPLTDKAQYLLVNQIHPSSGAIKSFNLASSIPFVAHNSPVPLCDSSNNVFYISNEGMHILNSLLIHDSIPKVGYLAEELIRALRFLLVSETNAFQSIRENYQREELESSSYSPNIRAHPSTYSPPYTTSPRPKRSREEFEMGGKERPDTRSLELEYCPRIRSYLPQQQKGSRFVIWSVLFSAHNNLGAKFIYNELYQPIGIEINDYDRLKKWVIFIKNKVYKKVKQAQESNWDKPCRRWFEGWNKCPNGTESYDVKFIEGRRDDCIKIIEQLKKIPQGEIDQFEYVVMNST